MATPLPTANLTDRARKREVELVAEMVNHAPLTLVYGVRSSGNTALARAVVAHHSRIASHVALVFDSWDDPLRLRDSIYAALCNRLGREAVGRPLVSCSLADNLRGWHERLGVTFLIVFDRFEQYLARPADNEETRWFDAEFIRALRLPAVRFLLALREEAKDKLARFAVAVPGFHDSWIRLPARNRTTPQPRIPKMTARRWRWNPVRLGLMACVGVVAVTVLAWQGMRIAPDSPATTAAAVRPPQKIKAEQEVPPPAQIESPVLGPRYEAASPLVFPEIGRTASGSLLGDREVPPAEDTRATAGAKHAAPRSPSALPQGPASAASAPPPLVYIHLREEAQRRQAERLVQVLPEKGITVSGIKVVERGPQVADLRYFRPAEAGEARRVLRALEDVGVHAQIKHIGGYETTATERQYELWLPPES